MNKRQKRDRRHAAAAPESVAETAHVTPETPRQRPTRRKAAPKRRAARSTGKSARPRSARVSA